MCPRVASQRQTQLPQRRRNKMLAIYKRELKSYFRSFIGFLFIAVTLFFLGLYFSVYNLMNGYPYFAYVVSSVTFLFMLTVPILTMRILAEEKRSKTDQIQCWTGESHKTQMCRLRTDRRGRSESGVPFLLQM